MGINQEDLDTTAMNIYRIEHGVNEHGMWYNDKGEYNPEVLTLLSDKTLLNLNMDSHKRYQTDGFQWFTGVTDLPGLLSWFTRNDIIELLENKYKVYTMESTQYLLEPTQVLYTTEGLVSKVELSLEELFTLAETSE